MLLNMDTLRKIQLYLCSVLAKNMRAEQNPSKISEKNKIKGHY